MDLDRTAVRRLEFVEVGAVPEAEPEHRLRRRKPAHATRPSPALSEPDVTVAAVGAAADEVTAQARIRLQPGSAEPRWSLWSDGEI